MSTPVYSTVSSLVCVLEFLAVYMLTHTQLSGYDGSTQLSLLGLFVLPQLMGLGSPNFALGRMSATTMSVALLLETSRGWPHSPPGGCWGKVPTC